MGKRWGGGPDNDNDSDNDGSGPDNDSDNDTSATSPISTHLGGETQTRFSIQSHICFLKLKRVPSGQVQLKTPLGAQLM